jgi:hypothetical protein
LATPGIEKTPVLEQTTLILSPWTRSPAPGDCGWRRAVSDQAGKSLGFVRAPRAADSWFFWLRTLRLDVFETDDEAHLMSLTRTWSFRAVWDVFDSEERHVGYLYPTSLVASEVGLLAFVENESRDRGRILDHNGGLLAQFQTNEAGQLALDFCTGVAFHPFLRMLVLGSVLTLDPDPRKR